MRLALLSFFVFIAWLFPGNFFGTTDGTIFPNIANAQSSQAGEVCHGIPAGSTAPAGFGVPWNTQAGTRDLLITAHCNATAATISVGSGSNNEYVYQQGYEYQGSQWKPITLQGANSQGVWFLGNAHATLSRSTAQLAENNFIVAYICIWDGSVWKCGCKDQACTQNYWQIQVFKKAEVPTGGANNGSTNGSAGGSSSIATEGFASCQNKPAKSLPTHDFSKVGYKQGLALPNKTATKTYGPGRHTITSQILLKSGDVLRGAGKDETTLYFPNGLKQMGLLCRNGQKITVTGGGTGDCFDWTSTSALYMGVIGAEGSEIGVEDLTIEFPATHAWQHYGNYNFTSGYNGFEYKNCTNCWIKNVRIKNSDTGIMLNRTTNNTLTGIEVHARPGGGHIHVAYVAGSNNLLTNFKMYGSTSHGLVANWGAQNNVFANGWSENVRLEADHSCGSGGNPCTKHVLYSNISGKIGSIQSTGRNGVSIDKTLWNVGSVSQCPVDAYSAQKK